MFKFRVFRLFSFYSYFLESGMGSYGLWVQPNVKLIEGFITLTVHMNQLLKFVIEKK